MTDILLTIDDIQKIFKRSRTWVWKMRKEGKIKPSKIDSRRFYKADIDKLMQCSE